MLIAKTGMQFPRVLRFATGSISNNGILHGFAINPFTIIEMPIDSRTVASLLRHNVVPSCINGTDITVSATIKIQLRCAPPEYRRPARSWSQTICCLTSTTGCRYFFPMHTGSCPTRQIWSCSHIPVVYLLQDHSVPQIAIVLNHFLYSAWKWWSSTYK